MRANGPSKTPGLYWENGMLLGEPEEVSKRRERIRAAARMIEDGQLNLNMDTGVVSWQSGRPFTLEDLDNMHVISHGD